MQVDNALCTTMLSERGTLVLHQHNGNFFVITTVDWFMNSNVETSSQITAIPT